MECEKCGGDMIKRIDHIICNSCGYSIPRKNPVYNGIGGMFYDD